MEPLEKAETVGASLVPVMVTVTVWLTEPPWPSAAEMVKVSEAV